MKNVLRQRVSLSLAVAGLALVLSLSSGVALGGTLIGTAQIKNGAVTSAKLHSSAVTSAKLARGAVTAAKLAAPARYTNVGTARAPFKNSWGDAGAPYAPVRFYAGIDGVVHLEGVIKPGLGAETSFVLPKGFRPSTVRVFTTEEFNSSRAPVTPALIVVSPNGSVLITAQFTDAQDFFSLDGVSFRTH